MRVLVVGGGGREHAIAWRWLQDAPHDDLIVAPGNAGTADIATNIAVDVADAAAVARLAREREVDIVVIGPDAAAAAGVADACAAERIAVFGPSAAAARIESSKAFAKELMDRAGIPTARWVSGGADQREGLARFIEEMDGRCVVKADGLALGKGVTVCADAASAVAAVADSLDQNRFGAAGERVVVEELLEGPEVSVLALTDGSHLRVLPAARDHKRLLDCDAGPNTGGMGAIAPAPGAGGAFLQTVTKTVLQPCIDALAEAEAPFVGCLYAGLMLTDAGIRVLEFNARFGDPEAQAVLPLLADPFPSLLLDAALARLQPGVAPSAGTSVAVVAAAHGYPGTARAGDEITGLDSLDPAVVCFHAGTRRDERGVLRTAGGRVLSVVAMHDDPEDARAAAYANLSRVHFEGMQYRHDIGTGVTVAVNA